MAVDIRCELCDRKIATVSYTKVKEYIMANGEVCGACQRKQLALEEFFEKKRERFMQQFNRLLDKAKTDLSHEIKRLASGGRVNKDKGKLLQDNGND